MRLAVLLLAGCGGLACVQERPALGLVGAAEVLDGRLRLTPAEEQRVGAAWFLKKLAVGGGFEAVFRFQITEASGLGGGADGFAFVLQNEGADAMAGRGSAGGFALGDGRRDREQPGISRSIAVFFDTFRNDDGNDPSDNYVAICTNGAAGRMRWPPNRLGLSRRMKTRLKDGQVHEARIRYAPPLMTVALDGGEPVVKAAVDLRTVMDAEGKAYVGFTASTGSGWANHDILAYSFRESEPQVSSQMFQVESTIRYALTGCLEGRNLCTPPEAEVRKTGEGRYHVVLPGHLAWGASLPNAEGRKVAVANARGAVCWDAQAADGCSGPEGLAGAAGDGWLSGREARGALIVKTEGGRTFFSVNGMAGRRMARSEGYFEFDAIIE